MILHLIVASVYTIGSVLFLIGIWKAARVIESADALECERKNVASDCIENLEIAMRFMEQDFSYKDAVVVIEAIKRKYEL